MPTYSNPGVYVSESPLVNNARRASSAQSTAVFFGTAPRGPIEATLIDSWSGFKSYYGDIDPNHELGYAVYHYFANGGRDAYIVRVLHTQGSGTLATTAAGTVAYYPNGEGGASSALLTANAKSPGSWGAGLSVSVTSGVTTATASVTPTFNLIVYLDGVEVERWNEVSTDQANNRYVKTVVNTYSKYITIPTDPNTTPSAFWSFVSTEFDFNKLSTGSSSLAIDGDAVTDGDYNNAVSTKLETVEGVLILNAVGQYSASVVNNLIQKAESRGNSFVVIDPSPASDVPTIGPGTVNSYAQSSYAAVYYPKLKMSDPTKTGPAAIRDTFPGGAVVGTFIRSEVARTVAKAPAGYASDVRNAIGLTNTFTSAESATLYETHGVNLFKVIPGAGVIINGTRTLDKSTPGKYIPIRRSLNYLKQALQESTQFAIFEPNDERLWSRMSMTAAAILGDFWRAGGLKGASSTQAFYVICDETNNTANTVTNGEVHLEVGVALQYPAEFVVINISQWTGGSNTVSTL
jgi:phage tail sheath protein FI